jgi:hypothetical protein
MALIAHVFSSLLEAEEGGVSLADTLALVAQYEKACYEQYRTEPYLTYIELLDAVPKACVLQASKKYLRSAVAQYCIAVLLEPHLSRSDIVPFYQQVLNVFKTFPPAELALFRLKNYKAWSGAEGTTLSPEIIEAEKQYPMGRVKHNPAQKEFLPLDYNPAAPKVAIGIPLSEILQILAKEPQCGSAWYSAGVYHHEHDDDTILAAYCFMQAGADYSRPLRPLHFGKKKGEAALMVVPGAEQYQRMGTEIIAFAKRSICTPGEYEVAQNVHIQFQSLVRAYVDESITVNFVGGAITLGVWEPTSDIDFVLTSSSKKAIALKEVEKAMTSIGMRKTGSIKSIAHARVPIVTYQPSRVPSLPLTPEDVAQCCTVTTYNKKGDVLKVEDCKHQNEAFRRMLASRNIGMGSYPELYFVPFDISASKTFSIQNSLLFRGYIAQSEIVRFGIMKVKDWGKHSGVIAPKSGLLSSYSLSLLWIYYLLQVGEVHFIDPINDIDPRAQTQPRFIPLGEISGEQVLRLGELLHGFYRFYGMEFDWDLHVVSIGSEFRRGQKVYKRELGWEVNVYRGKNPPTSRHRCLCIQDPYELDLNLGKGLSLEKMPKVLAKFRTACEGK